MQDEGTAATVDAEAEDITDKPDDAFEPTPAAMEIVHTPQVAGQIIAAEKPTEIIGKATEIATALKDLIDRQGLAVSLGGSRKHVEVGGWQALGSMLGALGGQALHAETVWTRPVAGDDGKPKRTTYTATVKRYHKKDQGGGLREETTYEVDGLDWEARVEIRTAGGVVVGTADAMVGRAESTWATRDDYALRSMAETRAESRAYRRACGWIVNLAGYSPTPAEEMPGGGEQQGTGGTPAWAEPASAELVKATKKACQYLTGSDNGEAAKLYARLLPGENAPLPRLVGQVVVIITTLVQKRAQAAAQDKAAEKPDPTPAEQAQEAAAATDRQRQGTIDPQDIPGAGTLEATEDNIARHCICDTPGEEPCDDSCPIKNHGIPF